jgi:hypothetical protein
MNKFSDAQCSTSTLTPFSHIYFLTIDVLTLNQIKVKNNIRQCTASSFTLKTNRMWLPRYIWKHCCTGTFPLKHGFIHTNKFTSWPRLLPLNCTSTKKLFTITPNIIDAVLITWQLKTTHYSLEGVPGHKFTNIVFNTIPITYLPITLPITQLKYSHFN